jgi:hypothetical protein
LDLGLGVLFGSWISVFPGFGFGLYWILDGVALLDFVVLVLSLGLL